MVKEYLDKEGEESPSSVFTPEALADLEQKLLGKDKPTPIFKWRKRWFEGPCVSALIARDRDIPPRTCEALNRMAESFINDSRSRVQPVELLQAF